MTDWISSSITSCC